MNSNQYLFQKIALFSLHLSVTLEIHAIFMCLQILFIIGMFISLFAVYSIFDIEPLFHDSF